MLVCSSAYAGWDEKYVHLTDGVDNLEINLDGRMMCHLAQG